MSPPPAPGSSAGKKRGRASDPAPLWALLPEDLVRLVAWRVLAAAGGGGLLDYVRFRAVCAGWRSGAASPRGHGVTDPRFHPRRWMMLPEGHCLHPGHPDRWMMPSASSTLSPATSPSSRRSRRFSRRWWTRRSTAAPCCTGSRDSGPEPAPLLLSRMESSLWKYWTAAPPLAFQGKLYMLETTPDYECGNNVHKFLQVGPPVYQDEAASGGVLQPPEVIATITGSKFCDPDYLVECDSEILVLGYRGASMSRIVICKLADLVQQRFIPMRSIGDNTLFVGGRCISVSSKVLSTVTGDNVACTHPRKSYLAQYHLSSGTWSPAIDDCSLYGRAQGPSSLVHYVVSCCTRTLWNRGIVLRRSPPGSYAWMSQDQVSRSR
ncbi:unnamed protein product [Urochloa decumbens]|uniref:Uncharacterized protein n=1 Tax=Urochloa decumbens TaxID=240449 RepID=A0ABC9F0M7_9POAL